MFIAGAVIIAYLVILLFVEVVVWRIQPAMDGGVMLIIPGDGDALMKRTVYGYRHDGTLYVSSNHWFRSWYRAALRQRDIEVLAEGLDEPRRYTATIVAGDELSRVREGYNMGFFLRLLCGFAPRKFLRLDPVG